MAAILKPKMVAIPLFKKDVYIKTLQNLIKCKSLPQYYMYFVYTNAHGHSFSNTVAPNFLVLSLTQLLFWSSVSDPNFKLLILNTSSQTQVVSISLPFSLCLLSRALKNVWLDHTYLITYLLTYSFLLSPGSQLYLFKFNKTFFSLCN